MSLVDHPSQPLSHLSTRDLRRFAAEALKRHPDLRELVPDPDARFNQALVQAFQPGGAPQAGDLREAMSRALDTHDDLQRLWALTDLAAALAAGFDPNSGAAEASAEIGAEISSLVHENAHAVADHDVDLLDPRWVEVTYLAWARGWPWAEELSDALAHGVEGDPELTEVVVRLAEADAGRAADPEGAARPATLALRCRVAAGQLDEARALVGRYGLGVAYSAMLASAGRVPEILVQHTMLLDERHEYATVAMGLALAGYPAEARALAEAGRAWGTGDTDPIEEVLAQIPEVSPAVPPEALDPTQLPAWGAAGEPAVHPLDGFLDDAYSALEDGRWAEAVQVLLDGQVGFVEPHFCAWVAEQAEQAGVSPRDLAALLEAAAEGEIFRANRKSYAKAVRHLEQVRRLLVSAGDGEKWRALLADLRQEHARKTALLEALDPLLQEAGLS